MEVARLIDLVGLDSVIDGKTVENTLLVGPAVVALIANVTMDTIQFDGSPESLFIVVPEGRWVQGVVGIRNSVFRNCRFQNIAFIGTQESIDHMKLEIGFNQADPAAPLDPSERPEVPAQ